MQRRSIKTRIISLLLHRPRSSHPPRGSTAPYPLPQSSKIKNHASIQILTPHFSFFNLDHFNSLSRNPSQFFFAFAFRSRQFNRQARFKVIARSGREGWRSTEPPEAIIHRPQRGGLITRSERVLSVSPPRELSHRCER